MSTVAVQTLYDGVDFDCGAPEAETSGTRDEFCTDGRRAEFHGTVTDITVWSRSQWNLVLRKKQIRTETALTDTEAQLGVDEERRVDVAVTFNAYKIHCENCGTQYGQTVAKTKHEELCEGPRKVDKFLECAENSRSNTSRLTKAVSTTRRKKEPY